MKNFLTNIGTKLSYNGSRVMLKLKKASPDILLISGIVGFGATVVLACRATVRSEEILDRHKELMDKAKEAEEVATPEDNFDISREKFAIYKYTVLEFAKIYALPTAVGALSLGFILKSNNIMKDRYIGAVGAFNAVSEAFGVYRDRVRGELGEEIDRHFRYGTEIKNEKVQKIDEKGKEKIVEEEKEYMNKPFDESDINRVFDESNINYTKDPALNMRFISGQMRMANDILRARGHLFLNEVYDMLGFDHTPEGALCGWINTGKGYVDFGNISEREYIKESISNGVSVIPLDFNIDGIIYDKI